MPHRPRRLRRALRVAPHCLANRGLITPRSRVRIPRPLLEPAPLRRGFLVFLTFRPAAAEGPNRGPKSSGNLQRMTISAGDWALPGWPASERQSRRLLQRRPRSAARAVLGQGSPHDLTHRRARRGGGEPLCRPASSPKFPYAATDREAAEIDSKSAPWAGAGRGFLEVCRVR